ncbi:MAG TPA: hypothetical protein VM911_23095, partial [Pyrinomonadaceae bacterium]|nr:hypothetical protein [Pyrinomonadaceae bacterium]
MDDSVNKFERFRQEHARLHDPSLVRGAVEFIPVEMSEVLAAPNPGVKKKKKRHGLRAGWTASLAPPQLATSPTVELPEAERLLPSGLMRKLRTQAGAAQKTADSKTPEQTPKGEPRIEVEPQSVTRSLSMFQEQSFALDASAAQQVDLIWYEDLESAEDRHQQLSAARNPAQASTTAQGELQRVVMDHTQADRFETRIGIADGAYLFAFVVDGYMLPDARFARRVLLTKRGLFAPLTLARREQALTLTNKSKADERILLEPSVSWIVPEQTQLTVPAHSSVKIKVSFHLPEMPAEFNQGLLHLSVVREEGPSVAGVVHFAAQVEIGGALPEISFSPREFGEVKQGIDEPHLSVEVLARGRGPLTGMISLPHSGELADFRLEADMDGGAARFAHTFKIESANLPQPQPHRTEASLKVMLITDSFLSNYRLCR